MNLTSSSRIDSFQSIVVYVILMSMLVSTTLSIRVDWNTNKGPIIPPTPTPLPPPPQQPFREPAPVWEDQSNDIQNPNPYRYVPPPPSRPRYNQNNDIETNEISNNDINGNSNGYAINKQNDKQNNYNNNNNNNNGQGFFVDVPPKLLKSVSPAKQQYYLQQYFDEVLRRNFYDKNVKYNIIAFKNTYRNVPYYVFYFAKAPQQ